MLQIDEPLLGETLHAKDMRETTDEEDEILSLCDLPLYGDQNVEESQGSSSMSSSENDYFEFFSQELSPSTSSFPPENIVFCGKLIPYKQRDTSETDSISQVDGSSKKQASIKEKHGWVVFRWKLSSTRSSKNGKKSTALMHKKDHHASRSSNESTEKMNSSNKQGKAYDVPVHKISMLTSSSSGKGRWYLFLFGISRFSSEVELRDIKGRLSRRHCSSLQPPMFRRNGSSGLWGLIRVLSCGGNRHPNTMVATSIASRPQE